MSYLLCLTVRISESTRDWASAINLRRGMRRTIIFFDNEF